MAVAAEPRRRRPDVRGGDEATRRSIVVTLRRLLAVTHQATLTGAPMCLVHLLAWMKDNTDVEVHTVVLRDGPLRPRFEAVGEVTVLDGNGPTKMLAALQHGLAQNGSRRAWRPIAAARLKPQLR